MDVMLFQHYVDSFIIWTCNYHPTYVMLFQRDVELSTIWTTIIIL